MQAHPQLVFHHVAFAYDGSPAEIVAGLSLHVVRGWTGIVGANGAGKTTILQLATGLLAPLEGSVQRSGPGLYCAQRTDEAPSGLAAFAADTSAPAAVLRRHLRVDPDWLERWDTLSHGERKRAQLAVALWLDPVVLALDEPTNHLDEDARALVAGALRAFTGVGLLVSHDRVLLDDLCGRCLFLGPGRATLRPGDYSTAVEQERHERESARRERGQADVEFKRLRREQHTRRTKAEQAQAKRSGRKTPRHDKDATAKRKLAILTGKDGQAGRLLAQMEKRVERAREQASAIRVEKEAATGIWIPGARSRRRSVLALEEGELSLGGARRLVHPALAVGPTDRIALTGPNGAGKSTLVRTLLARADLPAGCLVYLPQELPAEAARQLLTEVGRLPDAELGRLLTIFACLGSQPERLLQSELPSPGEARKLLLALGVLREPHLIVMDEPTNHLDLPAVEALEDALDGCPCALLLVSHDRRFLERLGEKEWRLAPMGPQRFRVEVREQV